MTTSSIRPRRNGVEVLAAGHRRRISRPVMIAMSSIATTFAGSAIATRACARRGRRRGPRQRRAAATEISPAAAMSIWNAVRSMCSRPWRSASAREVVVADCAGREQLLLVVPEVRAVVIACSTRSASQRPKVAGAAGPLLGLRDPVPAVPFLGRG